ncbi:G-protein coupled receptors family 2 profile 2 domain-containing protein [Entamoeba marina]
MKQLLILVFSSLVYANNNLNVSQSTALLVENTLTSTLSLVSTLFVAYSMVYLRLLGKGIGNRMIFCLLGSSFFNQCIVLATLFILQTTQIIDNNTCKFFACLFTFTDLAQCFWVLAIAVHIGTTYFIKSVSIKRNYFLVANIFVWGLSLVLSIIPIDNYDKGTIWCTTVGVYWDFFSFYVFVAIVAVLILIIYTAIIVNIVVKNKNMRLRFLFSYNSKTDDAQSFEQVALIRKMAIYPFLYIVCWIVPFFNRFFDLFDVPIPYQIEYVHCFTIPLLGFLNCLYYSNDVSLMMRWRNYFRSWGMCYSCIGDEEELILED